jgi:hypothetical protein
MTGEDTRKFALIRMGDEIAYLSQGAELRGRVCGWTSTHTPEPMVLVRNGYSGPDARVPLHAVLARERPGGGIVRFE